LQRRPHDDGIAARAAFHTFANSHAAGRLLDGGFAHLHGAEFAFDRALDLLARNAVVHRVMIFLIPVVAIMHVAALIMRMGVMAMDRVPPHVPVMEMTDRREAIGIHA
jgi:hypothetical protein